MAYTTVWRGHSRLQRLYLFLKQLLQRANQNDFLGLAAEMAYNFMMAFVPLLIFIVSVFGIISADSGFLTTLLTEIRRIAPPEAFEIISRSLVKVSRESSGSIAAFGLAAALWTSSNGAMVIIKGLNRAYQCGTDRRSFWQQRLVALGLVLGMAVILIVCSNLLVFGGMIADGLNRYFALGTGTLNLINALRWAIGLGALLLITNFIYVVGPDYKNGPAWQRTWTGTFTFVALWGGLSWLFSLYVANMGRYSEVYGPMGAVIILMLWLYLTSVALLVGGQVNALRSERDQQQANR